MVGNIKIVLVVSALMLLTACNPAPPWQEWIYDGPPNMDKIEYPPKYVQGWQDGCHTGTSATANHWYKFQYSFKQNAQLAQDRVYYKGWKDAFDYCQRYIYQYSRRTFL